MPPGKDPLRRPLPLIPSDLGSSGFNRLGQRGKACRGFDSEQRFLEAPWIAQYHVHPNMIASWKQQAEERLLELFSKKAFRTDVAREAAIRELHEKIGRLTLEEDFLAKAFGR